MRSAGGWRRAGGAIPQIQIWHSWAVNEWAEVLADLERRRTAARAMGSPDKLARQVQSGKLNARERTAELLDDGSFTEIGLHVGELPADGFVAGVGMIDGRPVAVGAEDVTVAGGSIGGGTAAKRQRLVEMALRERMPLITLLEGAGHRPAMPGDPPSRRSPNDLQTLADASGRIPMAVAVMGASAGHGALAAPLANFTVMTAGACIFAAGPPLVKAATGEDLDKMALGGPEIALASGLIHNLAADDLDALAQIRRWLAFMPQSAWQQPARLKRDGGGERSLDDVLDIVPRNPRQAYDMVAVIDRLVDAGSWFEVQPVFGASLLTGLARIGGWSVAIVANQPQVRAGAIDADAADKAAQFITVADSFHLPLIMLTDNPGVLAGSVAERSGILRHAGRMFAAQHAASVPKIQVTFRKAFGFGSTAMGMNPFDNQTLNLAFPGVTFGAMPARGADDALGAEASQRDELLAAELASGYRTAAGMSIDDVIDPRDLRTIVLRGLNAASSRLTAAVEPVARYSTW
jgi:methylmalonyl-CoA decarboxylase subunit alpha